MLTVKEAKQQIKAAVEELQKQGVWVKTIQLHWSTEVDGSKDAPKLPTATVCEVVLGADL